jgi:alkylation response protein AidB-like acyl-CoA dehydrogenase
MAAATVIVAIGPRPADHRYTRIAGGANEILRELVARSL